MKQLSSAMTMYLTDNKDIFPMSSGQYTWDDRLIGYDGRIVAGDSNVNFMKTDAWYQKKPTVYQCPSDTRSESGNQWVSTAAPRSYSMIYGWNDNNRFWTTARGIVDNVSAVPWSGSIVKIKNPSAAIIMTEFLTSDIANKRYNTLGYNDVAVIRPSHLLANPQTWFHGAFRSNYVFADGHVAAFDFAATSGGKSILAVSGNNGAEMKGTAWDAWK
jgi:prepilin-type processing-associated H-X9-DG protein